MRSMTRAGGVMTRMTGSHRDQLGGERERECVRGLEKERKREREKERKREREREREYGLCEEALTTEDGRMHKRKKLGRLYQWRDRHVYVLKVNEIVGDAGKESANYVEDFLPRDNVTICVVCGRLCRVYQRDASGCSE